MEKKRKLKGAVGSLPIFLTLSSTALILCIAFAGILILTFFYRAINTLTMKPDVQGIITQTDLLQTEQFSKFNISKYLGDDSYIEVCDENGIVFYASKGKAGKKYDTNILEYVGDVTSNDFFSKEIIESENGEKGFIIYQYKMAESTSYTELVGTAIFDSQYNLLYTNLSIPEQYLNREILEVLFQGDQEDDTYLRKYTFFNNEGQLRYLILHISYYSRTYYEKYNTYLFLSVCFFVFFIFIAIAVFVTVLRSVVVKPLTILKKQIDEVSKVEPISPKYEYKGPKEFVEIIERFHIMSNDLVESRKEQKKLEEEKRKIIADISHDLKTPITVIRGYSTAIADGIVHEDKIEKYLQTIKHKSIILEELINALFEFSQLDHPQFQLKIEYANMTEYLREYLALKYDELILMGYECEIDIPEEKFMTYIDLMQYKRVFENIISNSLKYNKKGTTIYISMKIEQHNAVILIGDNGVGISDEFRERVFQDFVVGEEARTSGKGTGLGLSVAKKIVEKHGGKLTVLSANETKFPLQIAFKIIVPSAIMIK